MSADFGTSLGAILYQMLQSLIMPFTLYLLVNLASFLHRKWGPALGPGNECILEIKAGEDVGINGTTE